MKKCKRSGMTNGQSYSNKLMCVDKMEKKKQVDLQMLLDTSLQVAIHGLRQDVG
jgi:hypothetical protein